MEKEIAGPAEFPAEPPKAVHVEELVFEIPPKPVHAGQGTDAVQDADN